MTDARAPMAKGSTFRTTLDFLEGEKGTGVRDRILRRLPVRERKRIRALGPTEEAPFELLLTLWRAADEVLGRDDPTWMERSGAYSIASLGQKLYGGILKKRSPLEFLTQSISLFRLYYQPGDMEVVEHERKRAVLRLVGFPPADRLFCRRQTGGLECALQLAGGSRPGVRHVRCVLEGDAFCEWELRWD